MDKELTIITEPEELIAWADTFDILLNPSIEDAAILLNYMEGHDYAIGIDSDGKMYRQDIAEENGEIEPYLIDDVIDIVCEWNYELILDAEAHRSDPKDFNDYNEYQSKYESLKADEKRLDRLPQRKRGSSLCRQQRKRQCELNAQLDLENAKAVDADLSGPEEEREADDRMKSAAIVAEDKGAYPADREGRTR